jgi:hypothetical protein
LFTWGRWKKLSSTRPLDAAFFKRHEDDISSNQRDRSRSSPGFTFRLAPDRPHSHAHAQCGLFESRRSSDAVRLRPGWRRRAAIRHRAVRTKGALSTKTAKLMVFKLVDAPAKTRRRFGRIDSQHPSGPAGSSHGGHLSGRAARGSVAPRKMACRAAVGFIFVGSRPSTRAPANCPRWPMPRTKLGTTASTSRKRLRGDDKFHSGGSGGRACGLGRAGTPIDREAALAAFPPCGGWNH